MSINSPEHKLCWVSGWTFNCLFKEKKSSMFLYPRGIDHHVINIRVSPGRTCSLLSQSAVSLNTSIQPVRDSKEHGTKTLKSFSQLLMVCNWQKNPASCFFDSFIAPQLDVVLISQILLCLLESPLFVASPSLPHFSYPWALSEHPLH